MPHRTIAQQTMIKKMPNLVATRQLRTFALCGNNEIAHEAEKHQ